MKNKGIRLLFIAAGSFILAFGLYHIHAFSGVTEGGVLGLSLLFLQWFSLSPAITTAVCNLIFYAFGYRVLGKEFLLFSLVATFFYSLFYGVISLFPPLWPQLVQMPLAAAVLGSLFVGVGVGLCLLAGSAVSGDDALAMGLSSLLSVNITWIYLVLDLVVLGLSLTYIPIERILFSLLSVILSGRIVGLFQKLQKKFLS